MLQDRWSSEEAYPNHWARKSPDGFMLDYDKVDILEFVGQF